MGSSADRLVRPYHPNGANSQLHMSYFSASEKRGSAPRCNIIFDRKTSTGRITATSMQKVPTDVNVECRVVG